MNMETFIESALGEEVSGTIEEYYLDDYETFKFSFAKLGVTREIYEELKKDDNWALYDYTSEWNRYYPGWQKKLTEEYKKIQNEESNPLEAEVDFLESDAFNNISTIIAAGVLTDGIKDIKNKKRMPA